ncbi:ankyrin repeat domain-containing protein SOWAHA-like [Lineus longissimus]|uniref:ankyrin repeat domain-containing protein SOWAHA-like n=1 Tax=Lineus longissimus TaxID=88925 RepID=UPI00315D8A99
MANILELVSVKEYLVNHGGKVRNHDLVTHFKGYLNDPENKTLNRETFKECVNKLAIVKSENGEKMIILKKKYRQMSPPKIDENVNPEPNGRDVTDSGQNSETASREGSADAGACSHASSSTSGTPERSRESSAGAQADVSRESSVSMEEAGVHEASPIVSVKDRAQFLNSIQTLDDEEEEESPIQLRKKTKVEKTRILSEDDPGLLNMTDPKEREWMVTSAKSDYQTMARMLIDFPNLAAKKELTSVSISISVTCSTTV